VPGVVQGPKIQRTRWVGTANAGFYRQSRDAGFTDGRNSRLLTLCQSVFSTTTGQATDGSLGLIAQFDRRLSLWVANTHEIARLLAFSMPSASEIENRKIERHQRGRHSLAQLPSRYADRQNTLPGAIKRPSLAAILAYSMSSIPFGSLR
jgi:hypothetical protein